MAFQNEAWFHHAVSENVTQLAQQKPSKSMGTVRIREGVIGKTYPFNRIGSANMVEQTVRDGDTQYANPPQSKRRAVLRDFSLAVLIDEFDQLKMLPNPQSEFAQILAFSRNRQLDDLIIGIATTGNGGILGNATTVDEAAETTSQSVIPAAQQIAAGGAKLTLAKIRQTKRIMDNADVDEEDRYFFTSPNGMEDLLEDTNVTSSDFNTIKALVTGGLPSDFVWMGYKWRTSTRLPVTGTIRSSIAWQRNAVGLAVGTIQGVEIDKAVHKNNNMQVLIKLSAGAVRVDDLGVVQIDFDEAL